MADVLNPEEGAVIPGTGPTGPDEGATTEAGGAVQLTPEIEALITTKSEEAAAAVRAEYEGEDGHVARAKRSKDKEIANLRKQLAEQQQARIDRAKELMGSDPNEAARIALQAAEEAAQQVAQVDAESQWIDWQSGILGDLGLDPESSKDAAKLVQEWTPKLLSGPEWQNDFQQAAAQLAVEAERTAHKDTRKRLDALEEGMEAAIQSAVTKALVTSGVVPDTSPEGGAVKEPEFDREHPSISKGLARRKAEPVVKRG